MSPWTHLHHAEIETSAHEEETWGHWPQGLAREMNTVSQKEGKALIFSHPGLAVCLGLAFPSIKWDNSTSE